MKKILSLTIVALMVIGLVAGGTWAFFSDTETSTGNQFAAGTLDLTIDGGNTDSLIFAIDADEGYPGMTAVSEYAAMKNIGSVTGKLGIEVLNVLNLESTGLTEYENDATGDQNVRGTATSGSTTTVVDSEASWTPDAYIGKTVFIAGKGSAVITDNDATSLTVGTEFSGAVAADDIYTIQVGVGELGAKVEVRIWVDVDGGGDFDDGVDYYLITGGTTSTSAAGFATAWDSLADLVDDYAEIVNMAENDEFRVYIDWKIPFGESADNSFQGDSVLFDLEFTLEQVS
jgi:predicted ribosomally synthesized peptide with SipW-like signal peptide